MESSILKKAGEFLKEKNRRKYWVTTVIALSMVVVFVTVQILKAPARAMNTPTYCGMEEHIHTEECYKLVLTCGYDEVSDESGESEPLEGTQEGNASDPSEENEGSGVTDDPSEESKESDAADASEESKESDATEPSEENGETDAAEPSEETQGTDAAEPSEETQGTDAAEPSEETQGTDTTEPSEETQGTDATEPSEEAQGTDTTEPSEETQGTDATEPLEEAQSSEAAVPSEEAPASDEAEPSAESEEADTAESKEMSQDMAPETQQADDESTAGEPETVAEEVTPAESETATDDNASADNTSDNNPSDDAEPASDSDAAAESGTDNSEPAEPETAGGDEAAEPESTESQEPAENETTEGSEGTDDASETPEADGETAAPHVHTDDCYELVLVCEKEEHTHTDKCHEDPDTLVYYCEDSVHVHDSACFDEDGNIVCGQSDFVVHVHTEDCYNARGELACPLPEIEAHVHTEECYGKPAEDHEAEEKEPELICGMEGTEPHVHTEECYDGNGELTCSEQEGHTHTEECYGDAEGQDEGQQEEDRQDEEQQDEEELVLICEKEERELELHTHTEGCYDENGILTCGKTELLEHVHSAECHVEPEAEEFTYYCLESVHEHEEECYDENGALICGKADFAVHTHTRKCYGADKELICPLPEIEEHVHTEECWPEGAEEPTCGLEEVELHTHTEACYDESGVLTCGKPEVLEHVHSGDCKVSRIPITKVYESENFIVTATYKMDANIPEEAEFLAEQITQEGNEEHFAQREEEYRQVLDNKKATISVLLKVGFYVDGEEVEPETPVLLTVQFLNEEGLEDGDPITVVHFGKDGTQVLEGSDVEDGSTSFEMDSFSEIAIGYEKLDKTVHINETVEYEDDAFHISFRLEGDVTIPAELIAEEDIKGNVDAGSGEREASEEKSSEDFASMENGEEASVDEGTSDYVNGRNENSSDNENADAFTVSIAHEELEHNFEFIVKSLEEDSEEYKTVVAYGEEVGEDGEELLLKVWSYSLNYNGGEVQLTDCKVVAEIVPTQALVDTVREAANMATMAEPGEENPEEGIEVQSDFACVAMEIVSEEEGDESKLAVGTIDAMILEENLSIEAPQAMVLELTANTFATRTAVELANPEFTVEYYAKLDVMATSGKNALPVIDTSGKKLPRNGAIHPEDTNKNNDNTKKSPNGNPIKNIYLTDDGNVITTKIETEVYAAKEYKYIKAPTVNYMNALVQNPHYELTTIKVLTCTLEESEKGHIHNPEECYDTCGTVVCGKQSHEHSEACKNGTECDKVVHTHNSECISVHFANRYPRDEKGNYILENAAVGTAGVDKDGKNCVKTSHGYIVKGINGANDREYVVLTDETVLRFVYGMTEETSDFNVAFYDYDISSGHMYTNVSNAQNNRNDGIIQTGTQKNDTLYYVYTKEAGINSASNYKGSDTKLAFGNVNTGTTMGENQWIDPKGITNLLNKFNGTQNDHPAVPGAYQGCTFGLVTGLKDGKIQYAPGVNAPHLFNDQLDGETIIGKTPYDNGQYTLKFNRAGDTYTLTAVNNTDVTGLESFGHPSPYDGKTYTSIWTNDFWPMDSADSFGANGHDLKFGNYDLKSKRAFAGSQTTGEPGSTSKSTKVFPESDDGKDHNSYFGMYYAVEFELSQDYVGPLEYYFFGDDDMWVFLDNTLVCDIGGVHSSVGEYVNLWDYLEKGSTGKHTLTFFYTERGASGSTCWMQFTLPSVSSLTPEQITGQATNTLTVGKTVIGTNAPTDLEYEFKIEFKKSNENLPDDYRYEKYDKDGKLLDANLIIWDGGTFNLGNGEYIEVKYLPVGTTYTIKETGKVFDKNGREVSDPRKYEIIIDGTGAEDGIKEGQMANTATTVNYINDYGYALPETGSSGTNLYTIAGAILASVGAGLLYRKKFRERRV